MKELVYYNETVGDFVTDSLIFAEYVGSRHATVVARIREIHSRMMKKGNPGVTFVGSDYTTARNDKALKFLITRKGFNALSRGFTKDVDYTDYDNAFDATCGSNEPAEAEKEQVVLRPSEIILHMAEELHNQDLRIAELEDSVSRIVEQIKSYLPKPAPSEEDLFKKDETLRDVIRKQVSDHCDKFGLDYGTVWADIYSHLRLQGFVFSGSEKSKLAEAEKRGWLGYIVSVMERLGIK